MKTWIALGFNHRALDTRELGVTWQHAAPQTNFKKMEILMHDDDLNEWCSVIPVITKEGGKLQCGTSGELLTSKMTLMGSRFEGMSLDLATKLTLNIGEKFVETSPV